MIELSLIGAFLVGLLGGGHCAGMCGGIVGAVTMTLPKSRPKIGFLLAYNLGRISSYALVGVIAGAIGASSFFLEHVLPIERILYGLASVMLMVLGLYLAGIWHGVTKLEKIGSIVWKKLQPLSKRFLPVTTISQAFLLGTIWGWLPCGLVYSVLVAALVTGSPTQGGILMLAFGLGTLPVLLAMGMAAVGLKAWLQNIWVRRGSGLIVLGFGVVGLMRLFN